MDFINHILRIMSQYITHDMIFAIAIFIGLIVGVLFFKFRYNTRYSNIVKNQNTAISFAAAKYKSLTPAQRKLILAKKNALRQKHQMIRFFNHYKLYSKQAQNEFMQLPAIEQQKYMNTIDHQYKIEDKFDQLNETAESPWVGIGISIPI